MEPPYLFKFCVVSLFFTRLEQVFLLANLELGQVPGQHWIILVCRYQFNSTARRRTLPNMMNGVYIEICIVRVWTRAIPHEKDVRPHAAIMLHRLYQSKSDMSPLE